MTELTAVLPDFPTEQYVRLLHNLEKNQITVADLLTLDYIEVAKRAQVPLLDVKRLQAAVLLALQVDLGVNEPDKGASSNRGPSLRKVGHDVLNSWDTISTLDDDLDRALGGGIPTGYITEITGESGVGKTQFLLTLLLSAQLASPHGISCNTLYISTESPLSVKRLTEILHHHPVLLSANTKPSLGSVMAITTPDIESQDHIIRYQVPVAIQRDGVRLIILDSVAANYRAEFDRPGGGSGQNNGANMAQRSTELMRLGQLLRDTARKYNVAVIVANQVADRFSNDSRNSSILKRTSQSSPLARRSGIGRAMPSSSNAAPMSSMSAAVEVELSLDPPVSTPFTTSTNDPMCLDHQQRWFTGWGDGLNQSPNAIQNMKTPSLGLIWTTQIACRIALIKKSVYGPGVSIDDENAGGELVLTHWRRWMKVVFAPHVQASGPGLQDAVEFVICKEGIRATGRGTFEKHNHDSNENAS